MFISVFFLLFLFLLSLFSVTLLTFTPVQKWYYKSITTNTIKKSDQEYPCGRSKHDLLFMSHRYIDHWFLDWMFVGLCSSLARCHKISKVQEPNPINVTISDVMPPMHRCQICSIHFTSREILQKRRRNAILSIFLDA